MKRTTFNCDFSKVQDKRTKSTRDIARLSISPHQTQGACVTRQQLFILVSRISPSSSVHYFSATSFFGLAKRRHVDNPPLDLDSISASLHHILPSHLTHFEVRNSSSAREPACRFHLALANPHTPAAGAYRSREAEHIFPLLMLPMLRHSGAS